MNISILEFFKRPVAYQPSVAKAFGSVNLGILWSQLYYWHDKSKDPDGWIYKTSADIFEETALTRREQETARKIGVQLGVLEEKLARVPATLHFRINISRAIEIMEQYFEKQKKGEAPKPKEKKLKTENSESYLTTMDPKEVSELAQEYQVTEKFVRDRADDVLTYCEAQGKRYKNYKAALRNFIKSELRRHPESTIKKATPVNTPKLPEVINRTPAEQKKLDETLATMRKKLLNKSTL